MNAAGRWSTRLLFVAICGLLVFVFVVRVSTQAQAVINERFERRATTNEARIQALEALNLPARLAILETQAAESSETRKLIYGVIATVIASLLAQLIQIRDQRRARKGSDG